MFFASRCGLLRPFAAIPFQLYSDMTTAIYPGTFDPVTNGHLDIISRATRLFDEVIVSVAHNSAKQPLFSERERVSLIEGAVGKMKKVRVTTFSGLLVDYARKEKATAIVRGLRAVSDFEYEFQLALMNRKMNEELETVFLMPNEKYTYLSASIIREVARLGGDISSFVPPNVLKAMQKRLSERR
jgi:pantetheine-phosphate adenylyltransferase